jgi:hypothetical protein
MGMTTAKSFAFPLFMVQNYALTAHPQHFEIFSTSHMGNSHLPIMYMSM